MSTRFDPLLPTFSRKEKLEVVTLVPVRENEGKVTKGKEKQAKVMVAFVVYENEAIRRICVKIILSIFRC